MTNLACLLIFSSLFSIYSFNYVPLVSSKIFYKKNVCLKTDKTKNNAVKRYSSLCCRINPESFSDISKPNTSFPVNDTSTNTDSSKALSLWGARILLLLVAALYGTNFGSVKILEESLEPSISAFLRFTVSALVFSPWLISGLTSKSSTVIGGLEVGLYSFIGYYTQSVALETTPASVAAFICSLVVVVVPLLDLLWSRLARPETCNREIVDGSSDDSDNQLYFALLPALLAAAGVGVLEFSGEEVRGVGDLLALGQPLFFGLAFWRGESLTRENPEETALLSGTCMATVAFGSLLWTLLDYRSSIISGDTEGLGRAVQSISRHFSDWQVPAAILWTGVVTTAFTVYGENKAMVKLSAAESTVIYATEPLWGTAFAAVTLGEQIGWNTVLGAVLVLSSCLLSSLGPSIIVKRLGCYLRSQRSEKKQ